MLQLFKNSFKTTNDCIILATPLIIFLSILSWYYKYAVVAIDTTPKLILASITIFVMLSGFMAAWLYMAKKTISLSRKIFVFDKDRAKALWALVLSLPKGIGRLFLPSIGVISIYILIYTLIFSGIGYIVGKFIGTIDFSELDYQSIFLFGQEFANKISELSQNELLVLQCWYILALVSIAVVSFITMLWIPEIVYTEKVSFEALYYSIIKIFTHLKNSIILYLYIVFLVVLISILNTFLMFNPILYFIVLLLFYYFLVYIVVLLFSYYEQTFIK